MLLLALEQVEHALNQVVYVEQLHLGVPVVDGIRQVVCHGVAESVNCRVVVKAVLSLLFVFRNVLKKC